MRAIRIEFVTTITSPCVTLPSNSHTRSFSSVSVIFLRATHSELVKAGYKGLDPKHELFLLYRPKNDDVYTAATQLKMREADSLDSADAGSLAQGTRVSVLKRSVLPDGKWRDRTLREQELSIYSTGL